VEVDKHERKTKDGHCHWSVAGNWRWSCEGISGTWLQRRCQFTQGQPIQRGCCFQPSRSGRRRHWRPGNRSEHRGGGVVSLWFAGIFIAKPFTDYTAEDIKALVSTNVEGFLYITQLSIKQMLAQKTGGSVVTITAALARNPVRGFTATVPMITKGGLETVTQHLAMEYAKDGIRVNAVAPGVVNTPLHKSTPREVMESLSPMGKPSSVKEIADAVMYLTEATTVTGDILYVDGGAHFGRW
jgi:hypothetical protein